MLNHIVWTLMVFAAGMAATILLLAVRELMNETEQ